MNLLQILIILSRKITRSMAIMSFSWNILSSIFFKRKLNHFIFILKLFTDIVLLVLQTLNFIASNLYRNEWWKWLIVSRCALLWLRTRVNMFSQFTAVVLKYSFLWSLCSYSLFTEVLEEHTNIVVILPPLIAQFELLGVLLKKNPHTSILKPYFT